LLFDGCHDDYHTVSWSSEVSAANFATCDIILEAHMDVTQVVSIEPVVNVIENRLHRQRLSRAQRAISGGWKSPDMVVMRTHSTLGSDALQRADGWNQLADALNPSHDTTSVFMESVPPDDRSDDGMQWAMVGAHVGSAGRIDFRILGVRIKSLHFTTRSSSFESW
jgi:hypothetical protein